ncbi:MAG: hypothetical protein IT449_15380 [Phycisphaerales bacterium]|nr:hypothetical protein [Phycisphaerales bacterium]
MASAKQQDAAALPQLNEQDAAALPPLNEQDAAGHPRPGQQDGASRTGASPTGNPPRGAVDLSQRTQRVAERINAVAGAPGIMILGQAGGGARVESAMMITVDLSIAASVSEDALACLYARAVAEKKLEAATPPEVARGAGLSPAGVERAARMRQADLLAGRLIAQAGYRKDGYGELLLALRGQDPRGVELAPFLSDDERQAAFLEGFEKASSVVEAGQSREKAVPR